MQRQAKALTLLSAGIKAMTNPKHAMNLRHSRHTWRGTVYLSRHTVAEPNGLVF